MPVSASDLLCQLAEIHPSLHLPVQLRLHLLFSPHQLPEFHEFVALAMISPSSFSSFASRAAMSASMVSYSRSSL